MDWLGLSPLLENNYLRHGPFDVWHLKRCVACRSYTEGKIWLALSLAQASIPKLTDISELRFLQWHV